MCDDDLDFNPFYKALQTTHRKKYEEAQNRSWLICVPQANSVKHLKNFSVRFVDMHLLKPSPYFRSQYMSTDQNESLNYEIEDGYIVSASDGKSSGKIKIITEELGYNEDLKHFRILVIERPLNSIFQAPEVKSSNSVPTKRYSFEECRDFLCSYAEHSSILTSLSSKLSQFNRNYLVLPDYLYDAACKLKDLIEWASVELFLSHKPRLRSDEKLAEEISYALEVFAIGTVHDKLYKAICEKFAENNRILFKKFQSLKGIKAADLKIHQSLSSPLPQTIFEVQKLDSCRTPSSKLNCLHISLETIVEEIRSFHENQVAVLSPKGKRQPLTTDDLIPILVKVLVEARPSNLESDLYYIENFQWNLSNKDRLSYCLVTFQAAVEFIKSTDLRNWGVASEAELNSCSPFNYKSSSAPSSNATSIDKFKSSHENPTYMDRELAKITRMLDVSTKELSQINTAGIPKKSKAQSSKSSSNSSSLGEFLSGLQQNSLGCSFGKQT